MKVYCAHPISGLTPKEVIEYYESIHSLFNSMGYQVYHPMTGKGYLREYEKDVCQPSGYKTRISNDHAIVERDKWMVQQADVVYLDLTGSKSVSIGCAMELAWAALLGKHTILVMEDNNVHKHSFVLECADIIFDNETEALQYMKTLINGKI